MKSNIRPTLAALLMMTFLAACSSAPGKTPVTRNLPGPPGYLQPVAVPPAVKGDSVRVLAKKRKAALEQANARIRRSRSAWSSLRNRYQR